MLVNDIEIVKEVVNVAHSLEWSDLKTSIQSIEEKHIRSILGSELYDALDEKVNEINPTLTPEEIKLLKKIYAPVSLLSIVEWIPEGTIKISGDGLFISKTETTSVPWQWQSDKLEFSCLNKGMQALDTLLEFLELNKDDYPEWTSSPSYTLNKKMFVNNTREFEQYYPINNSRRIFLRLKPVMIKVEDNYAKANLGEEYFLQLKTKIENNSLDADDKLIMDYVQKAIVHHTIAQALGDGMLELGPDGVYINVFNSGTNAKTNPSDQRLYNAANRSKMDGFNYFRQMKNYLDKNASDTKYQTYKNSSAYTDPNGPRGIVNKSENRFYAAR